MVRYALAQKGQLSYGIEGTPYTQEANPHQYFGYITENNEPPGGLNPQTPLNPGGSQQRQPYNWSPDEIDRGGWSVPIDIYDHNIPLECALGERAITDVNNLSAVKVADKHTFTEAPRLPTMTVLHADDDLSLLEYFIGCKANLGLTFAKGERLKGTMDITPASYNPTTGALPALSIPSTKVPFHFIHLGAVTVGAKTVATINSGDLNWDNGLEVNHHGDGREGYSVSEGTGAKKYDHKLNINVVDLDLFDDANDDATPVDVTIPFVRGTDPDGTVKDGVNIILEDCRILKHSVPNPNEGILQSDIELGPTNTYIEIITPI